MKDFITFIREQGVVGLAVGFVLGGAVSKTVSALVEDIINPVIGLILGSANDLSGYMVNMSSTGTAMLKYGAFISAVIDFLIIAAVVYYGFKALGLDKLDKTK